MLFWSADPQVLCGRLWGVSLCATRPLRHQANIMPTGNKYLVDGVDSVSLASVFLRTNTGEMFVKTGGIFAAAPAGVWSAK